jgi:hypothetical protein
MHFVAWYSRSLAPLAGIAHQFCTNRSGHGVPERFCFRANGHPELTNRVEIKAFEKFHRWHMVDTQEYDFSHNTQIG